MNEWESLRGECLNCRRCALAETRTNVVFGEGNPQAEVLCIGEGPGEQEDLTGRPFVGRGGKLLDDMLEIIDLSREKNIYIANMVKCRPPQNRDPLNIEQEACSQWLETQIRLIQPKIIICLGRIAAMKYIRDDFKITREHGQWFERDGILRTALYHPAAILRDPRRRPETFEDSKPSRPRFGRSVTTPSGGVSQVLDIHLVQVLFFNKPFPGGAVDQQKDQGWDVQNEETPGQAQEGVRQILGGKIEQQKETAAHGAQSGQDRKHPPWPGAFGPGQEVFQDAKQGGGNPQVNQKRGDQKSGRCCEEVHWVVS